MSLACEDSQPSLCFTYNPTALANACLEARIGHVTFSPNGVCVIGNLCVPAPTVEPPTADAYVEITAVCKVLYPHPCRVPVSL